RAGLFHAIDAARKLVIRAGIVRVRIGKINPAVLLGNEVVGAIDTLAHIFVGQNRSCLSILLQTDDGAVALSAPDESSLGVDVDAVRPERSRIEAAVVRVDISAGLKRAGIFAVETRLIHENRQLAVPLVDLVGADVAEQQISGIALLNPDRTLGV